MATSPESLKDRRLTTKRNAKSPGSRGLGWRTQIRDKAIVGEQSPLHSDESKTKRPKLLRIMGRSENPANASSFTECYLGKAGATNVIPIAQTLNFQTKYGVFSDRPKK